MKRALLKEFLEVRVDVRRGKKGVQIGEMKDEGKVKLVFEDGSCEVGDLLVGESQTSTSTVLPGSFGGSDIPSAK